MPAVVLRPSLVYATGSYGGTSLFRALCALPFFIPVIGKGTQKFQPIFMEDLTEAVAQLVNSPPAEPMILTAVGSEVVNFKSLLKTLRRWLGLPKAFTLKIPKTLMKIVCQLGSFFKSPVINHTAFAMLSEDNIVNEAQYQQFCQTCRITPKSFSTHLNTLPSYVQDRLHAKLYFLKPALKFFIGFLWVGSGVVSLVNFPVSLNFLKALPVASYLHVPLLVGASALDILLGIATWLGYKIKTTSLIQIALIIGYTAIISCFLPHIWLNPFGTLMKNLVIIISTLILMMMSDMR